MEHQHNTVTRQDLIRDKHQAILQQYFDLIKKEREENPQRAEHIGKFYYARVIAQSMIPQMRPDYILKVINALLRGDKRH